MTNKPSCVFCGSTQNVERGNTPGMESFSQCKDQTYCKKAVATTKAKTRAKS